MIKLNSIVGEGVRLDSINREIAKLERELDLIDGQGSSYNRARIITQKLERLRREKSRWDKIYKTIDDA